MAGLDVLRLVSEPTCSALWTQSLREVGTGRTNTKKEDEENLLVVDFGAGTYDVTLLSVEDGIYEVKATAGNMHLGGEDVTR